MKVVAFLIVSLCMILSVAASTLEQSLLYQGSKREYLLHVPRSYDSRAAVPLVFVFHGGNGNARQIARFTRFNEQSDKHNFIVVYPQALNGHWNDGRKGEAFADRGVGADDVGFVMELLRQLQKKYSIVSKRIYATGVSNGGIFCQRLAVAHSETFAAVATVIGSMAESLAEDFQPQERISVLIMNGTEDPLVPYEGGEVTLPGFAKFLQSAKRGRVLSTEDTIALWVKHDGLNPDPQVETLQDPDPKDHAQIEKSVWHDETVSVVLYKIIGGGHTYPGGMQYLPERLIGRTCRDINASEVIWDFFANQSKK